MNESIMNLPATRSKRWLLQGLTAFAALTAMHASADFTAYNDCTESTGNPANTTLYRGNATTSGFLKDFTTGATLPVTLTITASGLNGYAGGGGPIPNEGTDCYNVFNGKVVFDNVAYYGTYMEARFTGLDPNKEYEVVTSVNRGNAAYTTRTTQFTISDIDSATQAGTSGVTVNSPTSVTFLTGDNTVNGYVARWTRIKCGADGAFTLRNDNGTGISNGYSMDGIMLKESSPFLGVTLDSPLNNQAYPSGASIMATATPFSGTSPYTVRFYTRSLPGGVFAMAGAADMDPPYEANLAAPANGSYEIYAEVTDSVSAIGVSATKTFMVASPVPTSTVLGTSAASPTYGQSVTFTATLAPTPTGGTVRFYDGVNPLGGAVAVNTGTGKAQISTTALAVGTHAITAVYSGHGIYLGSTAGILSQEVTRALLTVTADNKIRIPGAANPVFTYKISGYQNGENATTAGVAGTPVLGTTANEASPEGTYDITCAVGSLNAPNYSFLAVKGTLTVMAGAVPVVNGLACWYDAAKGVTANGSLIQTWNDQSGNAHLATVGSGAPVLALNDINSRPAVHIRGSSQWLNCAGAMFTKEQYVVVRSPNANWNGSGSFLGRASNDFLTVRASSYNLSSGTTGFWQDHFPEAVSKNGTRVAFDQQPNNGPGFQLGTITNYMILKITVNSSASAANLAQYPYYHIGRNETLGTCDMDIAEIVGYDHALSAEDEALVGSYLADKYALATAYPGPAQMVGFGLPGNSATIDQVARTIALAVPYGTNLATLAPNFTVTSGTCNQTSGSPPSPTFLVANPATYTVTDGAAINSYIVTVTVSPAPIVVGPTGSGTLTFDALPAANLWSTGSVTGAAGDVLDDAAIDSAMSAIAASSINSVLGSQAGSGTAGNAYWRSDDFKLGTQPSGNKMTLLMATLQNASGGTIGSLNVSYVLGIPTVTPLEEIKGHRVYWSKTGAAGTWTAAGDYLLTTAGTTANISFTLTSLAWANGGILYVVWADDNGSNPDGDYTLDDISFTKSSGGYATWADENAPGQTADQDHDHDGVENGIEYFMGQTGASFTANPGPDSTGKVTWAMDPAFAGSYQVQTSPDLRAWTDRTDDPAYVTKNADSVVCTLPAGAGKLFVRLVVVP